MKLSKNSKQLMLFFTKNKYINKTHQTKRTDDIISELYNNIFKAYKHLNDIKQKTSYFNLSIKKIESAKQIPKPKIFNANSFPSLVRAHIDDALMSELTYTFSLFGRKITVHFVVEEDNIEDNIETYNGYIDSIIIWIFIVNLYASKQCANSLIIYIYFTSLKKNLPSSNIYVLNELNVNTAFTTTCPKDSEIVIYRKEEWFKVLIHESFHNFGLDFSDMNNNDVHNCILGIFKVNSVVNLYESYTEIWAEIMNAVFCSFYSLKEKTDVELFLSNFEFFINFERTYSFFQLIKTLNFMGLTYKDLISNTEHSKTLRENLYKEKTNVLSYYVIKTVLINNYQGFLYWCKNNNSSLLQFTKTLKNQMNYCELIQKNYKSSSMIENVSETQKFFKKVQIKGKKSNLNYILSNMRMSICELG
jgi:hypothetical protein